MFAILGLLAAIPPMFICSTSAFALGVSGAASGRAANGSASGRATKAVGAEGEAAARGAVVTLPPIGMVSAGDGEPTAGLDTNEVTGVAYTGCTGAGCGLGDRGDK